MRNHRARLERLESSKPEKPYPYVIRVSNRPKAEELAQMQANTAARKPFVIMPHKCKSAEEWMAQLDLDESGDLRQGATPRFCYDPSRLLGARP